MNRVEDVENIARIAVQSVSPIPTADRPTRPSSPTSCISSSAGTHHTPEKSRMPSGRTSVSIAIVLLVIAFLITLAVTFGQIVS